MKKILIVEDDQAISDLIGMNLSIAGYKYDQIYDGFTLLESIKENTYDLILLDVMLPGKDGFTLLKEISPFKVPVILITAKVALIDKVNGLKIGAEDYITKPFESVELLARIEVILRRYGNDSKVIILNKLVIDEEEHTVKIEDKQIDLTIKEYELLLLLYKNRNKAISRNKILEIVWGFEFLGETRTVDVHIQRLRKKLENNIVIATVYKYGYRMEIDI